MDKILILIPCLLTGGTEVASLETAKALIHLGYKVDVIVYFDEIDPAMLDYFTESSINVIRLNLVRSSGITAQLEFSYRLSRQLVKRRYRLVWLQYMTPTLLPLLMARLITRRLIAAVHVASSHYNAAGLVRIRHVTRYLCDQVVCVSNAAASGIFRTYRGGKNFRGKVSVIPNPIDCNEVHSAVARDWRTEFGWPTDVTVIGFAGRLAHIKGPDLLLKAVVKLFKSRYDIRIVIVGDGSEKEALQNQAAKSGISDIVKFAGRLGRSDIYGAIKGFDIAVVPSREEGFGLSALEAMAAGVPLVASRVDALKEVVLDGKTGLLFDPEDAEDLARTLLSLICDVQQRKSLADEGAAHAERTYGLPHFHQHISSLLRRTGLGTEP